MPDFEIYAPVQLRQKSKQTGQTQIEYKNQQHDSRYHTHMHAYVYKMKCNKKDKKKVSTKKNE